MEKNQKRKAVGGAVYVFCAFMLVTIMCIAIITAIGPANKTTDEKKTPETTLPADTLNEDDAVKEQQPQADSGNETTEKASETETTADKQTSPAASVPYDFYLPVTGYISKGYSDTVPVFSLTMNDYRTHNGIDISAGVGAAVCAFASGTVTNKYTDPFMGECLEITHDGGLVSKYMNLGEDYPADVTVGSAVYCGQTIACVGESAAIEAADESHLHFELTKDGEVVNPLEYIDYEPIAQSDFEG